MASQDISPEGTLAVALNLWFKRHLNIIADLDNAPDDTLEEIHPDVIKMLSRYSMASQVISPKGPVAVALNSWFMQHPSSVIALENTHLAMVEMLLKFSLAVDMGLLADDIMSKRTEINQYRRVIEDMNKYVISHMKEKWDPFFDNVNITGVACFEEALVELINLPDGSSDDYMKRCYARCDLRSHFAIMQFITGLLNPVGLQ